MALAAELPDGEPASRCLADRLLPVTLCLDVSLSASHRHPLFSCDVLPTHTSPAAREYLFGSLSAEDGFTGLLRAAGLGATAKAGLDCRDGRFLICEINPDYARVEAKCVPNAVLLASLSPESLDGACLFVQILE